MYASYAELIEFTDNVLYSALIGCSGKKIFPLRAREGREESYFEFSVHLGHNTGEIFVKMNGEVFLNATLFWRAAAVRRRIPSGSSPVLPPQEFAHIFVLFFLMVAEEFAETVLDVLGVMNWEGRHVLEGLEFRLRVELGFLTVFLLIDFPDLFPQVLLEILIVLHLI